RDSLYLSTDTVVDGGDIGIYNGILSANGLGAGAAYTDNLPPTIPVVPPCAYYLIVRTDSSGNVAETNEGNNDLAVPITVTAPDLVPTNLLSPPSVSRQTAFSVSSTVYTLSLHAALPLFRDSLYLSTDTVVDGGDIGIYNGILSANGLGAG